MEAPQEKTRSDNVLQPPLWITVLRGLALFISVIILGLCAALMHDAYLPEEGFSLAMALFTWFGLGYILVTEKVRSLNSAYNVIAVIVIDGLLMVLWLAAFASMAARRAGYVYDVNVSNCVDDGSLIDSTTCQTSKRALVERSNVILFKSGLAMTAAIAGLGALVWLIFIACFVWTLIGFLRGRKEGRFAMGSTAATPNNNYQMENKVAEATPMSPQTYPSQTQPQAPPVVYQDGTQYQQQQPPVQQQQQQPVGYPPQGQPYQQTQSPYQQSPSPFQQPQGAYPPPGQQNFGQYPPQQQPIQPQMTGQSGPVSTVYSSEMDGGQHQHPYEAPTTVSPPPQQYQQPYHPPQN
ncbi:G-protein coupled receptor protein [Dactylonectria estremocensis]|uniref:G-protein coupled receptor protein n=1 Tax=Dactylonectria estremocensis TaxID=1079267 RepID=A0A9P9JCT4_9HYPO|nr:G-protein coupled receptor protein [Dactylonectria estremocensis]